MSETPLAGRELDALIAEQVMGWTLADRRKFGWGEGPDCWITGDAESPTRQFFSPSTDIAAAWRVVERLKEMGRELHVTNSWPYNGGTRWMCEVCSGNENSPPPTEWYTAKADTAPLAICRAALAAVQGARMTAPAASPSLAAVLALVDEYRTAVSDRTNARLVANNTPWMTRCEKAEGFAKAALDAELRRLCEAETAWEAFAWHLSGCVECGQTSYENCFDGKQLHDAAIATNRGARAP